MWSISRKQRLCTLTRDAIWLGPAVTLAYGVGRMCNLYNIMPVLELRPGLEGGGRADIYYCLPLLLLFLDARKNEPFVKDHSKIVYPAALDLWPWTVPKITL
ncbi:hypothetical protein Trydic_g11728 [Trypoxylus dichotomus]